MFQHVNLDGSGGEGVDPDSPRQVLSQDTDIDFTTYNFFGEKKISGYVI